MIKAISPFHLFSAASSYYYQTDCEGDFYSSKDQVMNVFLIVEMCGVSLGQRQSWIASQTHSK